jgi:hypothetical protein
MGLFAASCPVDVDERVWIEKSMRWFRTEFGDDPLHADVVLPTPDFFPGAYTGSEDDVREVLDLLCGIASVDRSSVALEFYGDDGEHRLTRELGLTRHSQSTAGHYRREHGQTIIAVDRSLARQPVRLVATIAHELGHARLLGEGRITHERRDHEPLTTTPRKLGVAARGRPVSLVRSASSAHRGSAYDRKPEGRAPTTRHTPFGAGVPGRLSAAWHIVAPAGRYSTTAVLGWARGTQWHSSHQHQRAGTIHCSPTAIRPLDSYSTGGIMFLCDPMRPWSRARCSWRPPA